MDSLEALIFDVDGTLANTERDGHRVAFNRAFAEAGLDWEWPVDLYGELLAVAGGKERLLQYIERYRPQCPAPQNLQDFVARLHAAKSRHYAELVAEGAVRVRPGVRRLLREARAAGLRLAIATTTAAESLKALLDCILPQERHWFEVMGAGDSVPSKKPAPDIYNLVLRELKLAPDRCLAFEDSAQGLSASLAANLKTIVTVNEYTAGQDFAGAALVLDGLGEPEEPFRVLCGDAGGATCVDIGLLKAIHACG
jgi:HAD superfamily hydrolase (TIGR01509 family)